MLLLNFSLHRFRIRLIKKHKTRKDGNTNEIRRKAGFNCCKDCRFGVYLGNDEERVLLPKKQVPEGIEPGDPVEVFLYRDSSDRLIATTNEPKLTMGHLAVLEVADTGKMGAFLGMGTGKKICSFHLKNRQQRYRKEISALLHCT